MAHISPDVELALGSDFLQHLRVADVCPPLRAVVGGGWVVDEGATLLSAFRDSHFGDRSAFSTVGQYEAAVNGRGIPEDGIEPSGLEKTRQLMRRGTAFAWSALHAANTSWRGIALTARISVEPTLFDPDVVTGYVTFFAAEFADVLGIKPLGEDQGIQILLESVDCLDPLPS
ncbi:hypothetical protein [Actinomadura geliboluensis]|uniref:Uncharacterized protein n=1 Tax=Actinomadura geliboluensis TaxID=882440 RepID=A0A5S4GF82_9ACTN|nr:hypothetical protein [Actinomadura geliboluensis]TMR31144.1 hypothetical protein ETD96_32250 [Actinomadura geliboluensis]